MRAVCYARVSSAIQRDRETIASQLRTLPEFVERQGWILAAPAASYVDDGRTAKAGHLEARIGLAALLRDAAAHMFDVVVVVDVDRLSRSEDITERGAILGALQRAGVRIAVAATGQILDLSTSQGDLLSSIQGFFAAEWLRKHRERIVQGKHTALLRGRKPAGPTPFGLTYSRETGAWGVDEDGAAIVREIFERIAAGESCVTIGDDFAARAVPGPLRRQRWDRSTVYRLARSSHVTGAWLADKRKRITVAVPQIISADLYERAQVALAAHGKRGLKKNLHTYLLDGLATCGLCGAPILIRSATKQRGGRVQPAAYVCRRRKLSFRSGERCELGVVPVAAADALVWSLLVEQLHDPALAADLARRAAGDDRDAATWEADADGYRKHLARLVKHETGIMTRARRGLISEEGLEVELAAIARERASVAAQLATAERGIAASARARRRAVDAGAMLRRVAQVAARAKVEVRQAVLRTFVDPGGVRFHPDGRIEAELVITEAERTDGKTELSPGLGMFSRTNHGSELRVVIAKALPTRACVYCEAPIAATAHAQQIACSRECVVTASLARTA